jgi:hypothetical protein
MSTLANAFEKLITGGGCEITPNIFLLAANMRKSRIVPLFENNEYLGKFNPTKWAEYNLSKFGVKSPTKEIFLKDDGSSKVAENNDSDSLSFKLTSGNLSSHFDKHGSELGIFTIEGYEKAIVNFVEEFSKKLKYNQIIYPVEAKNKSNSLELRLLVEDLESGYYLILAKRKYETGYKWFNCSFYSRKIQNISKEEDIDDNILYYQAVLNSELYTDKKTLGLIQKKLDQANMAKKLASELPEGLRQEKRLEVLKLKIEESLAKSKSIPSIIQKLRREKAGSN